MCIVVNQILNRITPQAYSSQRLCSLSTEVADCGVSQLTYI